MSALTRHAIHGLQRLHQMCQSRPLGLNVPDGEKRRPARPSSRIARVFEPCLRLNVSRDRHSDDFGLRPAIAQRIAFVHDGDVRLDAAATGGMRFAVLLPAMTVLPLQAQQVRTLWAR